MSFLVDLITNKIFIAAVITYILTQFLKFIFYSVKGKRIRPAAFFAFGGMPSSHTSVAASLLTGIYFSEGISTLFVVALFIALVIIQDISIGRWHTQKHAQIINSMLKFVKIKYKPIAEFTAHTPLEIFAGAVLGFLIALAVFL